MLQGREDANAVVQRGFQSCANRAKDHAVCTVQILELESAQTMAKYQIRLGIIVAFSNVASSATSVKVAEPWRSRTQQGELIDFQPDGFEHTVVDAEQRIAARRNCVQ